MRKIKKLLCKIGIHVWYYNSVKIRESETRICTLCNKEQKVKVDWVLGVKKWQDIN